MPGNRRICELENRRIPEHRSVLLLGPDRRRDIPRMIYVSVPIWTCPFAHYQLPFSHCAFASDLLRPSIAHCPFPVCHCPLPIAHCQLPIAHCPLPTAHRPSPIGHCPFAIAYCPFTICDGPCAIALLTRPRGRLPIAHVPRPRP